jgi:peptide/nickel transport system substrate-binding protein
MKGRLTVISLVCLGMLAVGYTPETLAQTKARPAAGGRLVILEPGDPPGLDPQSTSGIGVPIDFDIYSTLITYKIDYEKGLADQEKYEPELAESWKIAPDRKSITFVLRRDAKFSDGSLVTAEDVAYSIKRAIDGKLGWGRTQLASGGVTSPDQVQVVDPRTVRVNFPNGLNRYSLRNFGTISTTVVSKKYCEAHATSDDPYAGKYMQKNPMGSGAYTLVSWKSGESVVLKARPDYWGEPKPSYTEIYYRIVPDSQTRMLLMKSGEADIVAGLTPKDWLELKSAPNIQVVSVPRNQDILTFRWNPTVPPFDDIKIRRAIIKAIPYKTILDETVYGFGTPVKSLMGLKTYGFKEYPLFQTNAEEAKRLVKESKYADGSAKFTLVVSTSFPERIAAAVHIQSALREIGITMDIQQVPYAAYFDRATKREYAVNLHSMGPWWNDALYWAYWMFYSDSSTNYINYKNAIVDEASVKALTVPPEDAATYDKLMKQVFDDTLVADAIAAPLYQVNWTIAVKKGIGNVIYWPWAQMEHTYLRPATK